MLFKSNYKKKNNFLKEVGEWSFTAIITIVIVLFITSNIVSLTQIKESSMEPSFKEDDKVIIYKLGYNFKGPKRGDIVILNKSISKKGILINMINEGKDIVDNISYRFTGIIEKNNLIKRVVAVPGDRVDIRDGLVYINNVVEEGYEFKGKTFQNSTFNYPIEVGENQVFVLGDNRENSVDSRGLGLIDYPQIKGKVIFRIWPLGRFGIVK